MTEIKQPTSALSSPGFCNMGTFMRMQKVDSAEGLDFVIAGAPFDTAGSFRSGSRFDPSAIRSISAMMKPNNVITQVNIMDELKGGDIGDFNMTPGYIHPTYQAIEEGVAGILKENACPIVLGGDHSITLTGLRTTAKEYSPVVLVHFDSHSDLYGEIFDQKYNHDTPFRRALEENLMDASHSIQVRIRGSLYGPGEHKMAAELEVKLISTHKVREMGLKTLAKTVLERVDDKPCFPAFGIDFVSPAYAPGTGTPEVGGFTSLEALELIRNIEDLNFVGFDLVEVLPAYDHGEITTYLAASIVLEHLSILAIKKKAKQRQLQQRIRHGK